MEPLRFQLLQEHKEQSALSSKGRRCSRRKQHLSWSWKDRRDDAAGRGGSKGISAEAAIQAEKRQETANPITRLELKVKRRHSCKGVGGNS